MVNNIFSNTVLSLGLGTLICLSANAEGFTKGRIKLPFTPEVSISKAELSQKSKTNLVVRFNIDSGSYLYKDSISVKVNPVSGIKIGSFTLPKAEKKLDIFTKTQKEIYPNSFSFSVPVEITDKANSGKISFSSVIGFQGCSKTVCFIPQEKSFTTTANIKKK